MKNVHVLYSGLGGHGREFFTPAAVDPAPSERLAAVFYGMEPLLPEYRAACERMGIPFRYVGKRRGVDLHSASALYRAFAHFRPEVITLHGAGAIAPAAAYRARSGARLVVIETQANALKTRQDRVMSRLAMRFADRVVCLTDGYVRELEALCGRGFRAAKVRVIPNAIDTSLFRPRAHEARGSALRVGMQGRLVAIKDHATLIRAFARVAPALAGAELHFAGGGELEGALRRLARELGVEDRVHFHGTLSQDALVEFMHTLDVYVHATLGESFCFSIMEAFGCGLPVIASRVPVLDTTLAGLPFVRLVAPRDAESLAAALMAAAADGGARLQAGNQARAYAERVLAPAEMWRRHDALLREILEPSG